MNPHFAVGRRRRRRHHPVCPISLLISVQPILEELLARAPSLRGLQVPSALLESRGGGVGWWHGEPFACEWGAAARRCSEPTKGLRGRRLFWRHLLRRRRRYSPRSAAARGTGTAGPRGRGRAASPRTRRRQAKGSSPSTTDPFPTPFLTA